MAKAGIPVSVSITWAIAGKSKMLETITAKTGVDYLREIRKSTKLTEKHYKIIEQQTTSTEAERGN